MKSREQKKQEREDAKLRHAKFLEDIKKFEELRKQKQREEDEKIIKDMTRGELKSLIEKTIQSEATSGNLPLLNERRKRFVEKWSWRIIVLIVIGIIVYFNFFRSTEYSVEVKGNQLFLRKTTNGSSSKNEIKVINSKWNLCSLEGYCSTVFTPIEASYNDSRKFIFVGAGRVYWVNNDRTDVVPVKLIDGSWSFKRNEDDEWTDFDSMVDISDYDHDDHY